MMGPERFEAVNYHYVAPPFGYCVYCGEPGTSKEHAIPFGLLGRIVLPKASCETCREVTHAFETACMNDVFGGAFRHRIGIPARKGRPRPETHATVFEHEDGNRITLRLRTADVPQTLSVPVLNPPKMLAPNPHDDLGVVWHRVHSKEFAAIEDRFGASGIVKSFSIAVFLQTLAKIGHCLAHVNLRRSDLDTFNFLVPERMRRGVVSELLEIVGGLGVPSEKTDQLHEVETFIVEQEQRELLCAEVRLFAFMGTPRHVVVVGERPLGLPMPADHD